MKILKPSSPLIKNIKYKTWSMKKQKVLTAFNNVFLFKLLKPLYMVLINVSTVSFVSLVKAL